MTRENPSHVIPEAGENYSAKYLAKKLNRCIFVVDT
jgi:hypothetical protein